MKLKHIPGLATWHIVTDRGVLIEQHANQTLAEARFEKLNQNAQKTIDVSQTQIVDAIEATLSDAEAQPEESAGQDIPEMADAEREAADVLDQSAGKLLRLIRNGAFDDELSELLAREEQGAARKTVIAALESRQE